MTRSDGLLLGVDIGTSSSKGALVDWNGEVVATASRRHELSLPRPGWAEHDPEAVWWNEFVAIARELTDRRAGQVVGVGVSGIGPCVLPVDQTDQPLRQAILYGIDTRAEREIAEQQERFGSERVLARCGSPITSQAVGPKLAWLARHEPDVWARARRLFMAHTLLVYRLTGAYVLDHHAASQSVPLYDRRAHEWITPWADEIAPGLKLPELVWPNEIVGHVSPAAATRTGIPAGTPVCAGTLDAWAEAFSVGVRAPGDVMVMYGSTMFLVEVVGEPLSSPWLFGTVGTVPGTHSLGAGMATSGILTDWVRRLTGVSTFEELVAEAISVPPGSDGLVMLPYFAGERTPLFDPDARGLLVGLTLRHGRAEIYRAALEATAFGVRHNLEAMRGAGGVADRLVAVGGGTQGGLWTRIVSNSVNKPQCVPTHTIGACFGDAMLAGLALDPALDVGDWNPVADRVDPDPEAVEIYETLYPLYRDLYPATKHAVHVLASLQKREE